MKYFLKTFLTVVTTILLLQSHSQEPLPFWHDIQAFKKQDTLSKPKEGQILFVGSSSFTKWQDVQQYFPAYPIINRGFGGSSLPDVIRYADDVIFPYMPKQIVIYCGENDLAGSDTITAVTVIERFKTLFDMIRAKLPTASIVFVSLKPSPSRNHLFTKMIEVNLGVRNFLKGKKHTAFVNVYDPMLNADKQPREDLFIEDRLHMNSKGYAIWQQLIQPHLLK